MNSFKTSLTASHVYELNNIVLYAHLKTNNIPYISYIQVIDK